MKKRYLILLLILSAILLSSCSIDWNDEKDKKIKELEQQIQDDTFKKNQECNKLFEEKKEKIYWDQQEQIRLWINFVSIWFSKKINSCYISYSLRVPNWTYAIFYIDDLLRKEPIFTTSLPLDLSEEQSAWKRFDEKIKELKWE